MAQPLHRAHTAVLILPRLESWHLRCLGFLLDVPELDQPRGLFAKGGVSDDGFAKAQSLGGGLLCEHRVDRS